MYNLTEYSNNYSKTSGSLWQYYKDNPSDTITDPEWFKSKVKIIVPLKYLSNFWRTLEMQLINCEVNLILTWSPDCAIIYINVANQIPTFAVTPVVIFSIQDNAKILTHLKSDFKRTISKRKIYQNQNC